MRIRTSFSENFKTGRMDFDFLDIDELIELLKDEFDIKFDRSDEDKENYKKAIRKFMNAVFNQIDKLIKESKELQENYEDYEETDKKLKIMKEIMYFEGIRDEMQEHFFNERGRDLFYYYRISEYLRNKIYENQELKGLE